MFTKIKEYFKKLHEAFKNLFKKVVATVVPTPPVETPVEPPEATVVYDLDTEAGWTAYRASFPLTTQAYIMTWEQKVAHEAANPPQTGGVDRTGFELKESNGWMVENILTNGVIYTFYIDKPGTIEVMGVSGNQINKVNGVGVIYVGQLPNQVPGPVNIVVESVNGQVAVQLV